MKRREFIAGLGSAVAWPLSVRAQQGERLRRVGIFIPSLKSDPQAQSGVAAFVQAFETLGWSEGRNVNFEFRWADGGFDQIRGSAKELVALRPDVIYAYGGAPAMRALAQETRVIPIVFSGVSDPVAQGFVESLARPGGNATGFSLYEASLGTKWLEAFNRLAPDVRRIALIFNPQVSSPALYLPSIEAAAVSLKVELHTNPVFDPAEIAACHGRIEPRAWRRLDLSPGFVRGGASGDDRRPGGAVSVAGGLSVRGDILPRPAA